jgi:hypothetical protein
VDPFSQKRLLKLIDDLRARSGQLPTFADLEKAGFDRAQVKEAMREGIIEEFYVTLTSGTVVKGFKRRD